MCKLVPVLRVVGFVFLVLAFVACLIGFLAPFWVRLPADRPHFPAASTSDDDANNADEAAAHPTPAGQQQPEQNAAREGGGPGPFYPTPAVEEPVSTRSTAAPQDSAAPGGGMSGMEESIRTMLPNGSYEGLWAKCYNNLTCTCFWSNNFALEKAFPDWHKAAQGLFSIGLLVLLVALVTASFHVCCCHCCRESFVIATVIGSLIAAGLLLVTFSLAVFGIFSTYKNDVQLTGSTSVFEWAFFVTIGGVGVALLAAILFIVDGCRGPSDSDGDGEETAKMV